MITLYRKCYYSTFFLSFSSPAVALLLVDRIDKLHDLAQSKLKLRALSQGLCGFRGLLGEKQE